MPWFAAVGMTAPLLALHAVIRRDLVDMLTLGALLIAVDLGIRFELRREAIQ